MKDVNIKCLNKIDIPDDKLPLHIGEEGITIDDVFYKNIKIIRSGNFYYIVSDKAVLTITCTAICNARCNFCYNGITFTPDSGGFIDLKNNNIERLLQFCKDAQIQIVSFSGGEPTLYPVELLELVEKFSKAIPKIRRLHTNGLNLNKKIKYKGKEKRLYEHLKDVGLTDISISVAHFNPNINAKIMNYDGLSYELVKSIIATGIDIRFSCYLDNDGSKDLEEFDEYLKKGIELGVKRFIFRLSSGIPRCYELDNSFSKNNRDVTIDVLTYVNHLKNKGFTVKYFQKKSDSHLYMLEREGIKIDVDRSLEEIDPDKKIRRIIYMPNNCTYTSWIDSTSFLFKEDLENIIMLLLDIDHKKIDVEEKRYPAYSAREYIKSRRKNIELERNNIYCDTHTHTSISDGWVTPTELILKAKENGVKRIVITDHNCLTDEFDRIREFANDNFIEIPFQGVEVSCVYLDEKDEPKIKMHMLVYANKLNKEFLDFISFANKNVNGYIYKKYHELKENVVELKKMRKFEEIYSIDDKNINIKLPKKQYTRTPLAKEVADLLNITIDESKEKYVQALPRKDRYKDNNWLNIKEVIEKCNELGYVTVLAHPSWIRNFNENGKVLDMKDLFNAIIDLKSIGLDGVEVGHRLNNKETQLELLNLAREFDLLTTGGSDFHGKPRCVFGIYGTTYEEFLQLKNRVDNKEKRLCIPTDM